MTFKEEIMFNTLIFSISYTACNNKKTIIRKGLIGMNQSIIKSYSFETKYRKLIRNMIDFMKIIIIHFKISSI